MLNLTDHNQQLPPGLLDGSAEFFIHEDDIKVLHGGLIYAFENMPWYLKAAVERDMLNNPKAMEALVKWEIKNAEDQMKQYVACRFGGFDSNPDITPDGSIHHREYFNCGRRGKCEFEGKLCASLLVANGELTKREIEVLQLIGNGLRDKEIIDKLTITQDTLRSHKDNISHKTGKSGKPELAVLAKELNLI